MITHVRNLVQDLIERRLWPFALVLAVAVAAVPVVLGRSDDTAPTAAAPRATPSTDSSSTAEKAEVTIDSSVPEVRDRGDHVRNPFKAPASGRPKTETTVPVDSGSSGAEAATPASGDSSGAFGSTDAAGSTSATGGTGSTGSGSTEIPSTGSGSTPGSGSTGTTTTKDKTTTAPKADDKTDTYHVSLRFGVNGGKLTTIRDVARLSPLPSVTDPFFVYLGVIQVKAKNEKRAVFIVSSDATPNGEGACHPTTQDCETVELTVGQTAYFDYTAPGGQVTQYELQLAGIHKTAVKAEAKAAAAFARHSVAGAELLRDAATRKARAAAGARAYRYLPGAGMLVRAKRKHVTAKAAAATGLVPGLALVDRKRQPGIPVWHSPKKPKK
jgi:hypothetical protein